MADLVEEEEMNAQGPARMSAVDDGLTAFNVMSPPLCDMDMLGSSNNVPRVKAAIDLVVDNMMGKEVVINVNE